MFVRLLFQIVPGHVGVAAMDHVHDTDPVCGRILDSPGFQRTSAVFRVSAGLHSQLYRGVATGDVYLPVFVGRHVRPRSISTAGGRSPRQPGGNVRVPRHCNGVQRPAVRVPTAVLRQGQVQRVIAMAIYTTNRHNLTPWLALNLAVHSVPTTYDNALER